MKKILGLDLGTSSIGWALIEHSPENRKGRIIGMGSRIISMGAELSNFERGQAQTKNANRRIARGARKLNKRYKQRRNKLIYALKELGMLPNQIQLVKDFFDPNKIDKISIKPIKKRQPQLTAFDLLELRVKALSEKIELKDLGRIIYKYNQLRGYAGGNAEPDKEDNNDDAENQEKKNESYIAFARVLQLGTPEEVTLKNRKFNKRKISIETDDGILDGETYLDSLKENDSLELQVNIRRSKSGESITVKLPDKTNWRKKMENLEKELKEKSKELGREVYISEHLFDIVKENPRAKIRNNVILRSRYESEFDAIWDSQYKVNEDFKRLVDNKKLLTKILCFIFPGTSKTQEQFRAEGLEKGLKHVLKNQIIFFQRELKDQSHLISDCRFVPKEKVVPKSHPVFQEYKIWEQINKLLINTKTETGVNRKGEQKYTYIDRPVPASLKEKLFDDLQNKKEISFGVIYNELKKKYGLREKVDFLNGLNVKAKLKGNETRVMLQKSLGNYLWEALNLDDIERQTELWNILYHGKGNEYDIHSERTSRVLRFLKEYGPGIENAEDTAIRISKIKFSRSYSNLSLKAIQKLLPLVRAGKYFDNEFSNEIHSRIVKLLNENVADPFEKAAQEFLEKNSMVLEEGGIVNAMAVILVYGKHTAKEFTEDELIKTPTGISFIKNGSLRNPLAEQIINETLAMVNDIWRKYGGKPDEIRVELARELKSSAEERAKIYSVNQKNQKANEAVREKLIELKEELSIANIEKYKLWLSQENLQEEYIKNYSDPSKSEVEKLKLWEEQGHVSPYTGQPIPLSHLFNKARYDIDHIIPKSRYFDDSFTNKVICEKAVNTDKGNRTAMEYFETGSMTQKIFSKDDFIDHANKLFTGKKRKNLLATKVPEDPIQRQIKDTQYIAVKVREELNKIVGNENVEATSGGVTDYLRNHWGLTDKFKSMLKGRYENIQPKLSEIAYNEYVKNIQTKQKEYAEKNIPFNDIVLNNELFVEKFNKEFIKKKNNKLVINGWSKRIDHRHHALDALIIACTQPAHIKRLNDLNKVLQDWLKENKETFLPDFNGSKTELLDEVLNLDENKRKSIFKELDKFTDIQIPWQGFVEEAEEGLKQIIVSHKPKDKLLLQYNKKGNRQIKLRGQLHEGTLYGKTNGRESYRIPLLKLAGKNFATEKTIGKIVDPFLKKQIREHLNQYKGKKDEAFSAEGILDLNNKLAERRGKNNNPAPHTPVSTIRIYYKDPDKNKNANDEEIITLQKLDRSKAFNNSLYVKTGDNYLFAVMEKDYFNKKTRQTEKKRVFDLITFFDAANLLKEEFNKSSDKNTFDKDLLFKKYFEEKNQAKLLFTLKQDDFVYLPEENEDVVFDKESPLFDDFWNDSGARSKNIYVVQKFSGKQIYFIKHTVADMIKKKVEFGSQDCYEIANGKSIKEHCFKLHVNRLGEITDIINHDEIAESFKQRQSSVVHEPEVVFQTKKVQFFDSLSEMDNEDARCMAVSPPEQHLKNATELNRNIFQEKLSHPMDKKLRFRE